MAGAGISNHLSGRDFDLAESKSRRYMLVEQDGVRHYYGTTYCDMEYVLDSIAPQSLVGTS